MPYESRPKIYKGKTQEEIHTSMELKRMNSFLKGDISKGLQLMNDDFSIGYAQKKLVLYDCVRIYL